MSNKGWKICIVAGAATAALLVSCDRSRQTADGSTTPGDAGAAAASGKTVASTGSPEQGGAAGTPSGKGVAGGMSTDAAGNRPSNEPAGVSVHAKGP